MKEHDDYTVGWVCALEVELAAAIGMLDERHPNLPIPASDNNTYALGRIGEHNVAIACLGEGETGIGPAARVASRMRFTFPAIKLRLMIGVGGGIPRPDQDPIPKNHIRLGDIVVSRPTDSYSGVIQYDYGKKGKDDHFELKGALCPPPDQLLTAIAFIKAEHLLGKYGLSRYLAAFLSAVPNSEEWGYQGRERDKLFEADYDHQENEPECNRCDPRLLVSRPDRVNDNPAIHYGLIASGNTVMKDGLTREKLRKKLHGVLCFEMEAAGLMQDWSCLVVRGICDYSDSHKNKRWQPYAAVVAAAYAKELLHLVSPVQVNKIPPAASLTSSHAMHMEFPKDGTNAREDSVNTPTRKRLKSSHVVRDKLPHTSAVDVNRKKEPIAEHDSMILGLSQQLDEGVQLFRDAELRKEISHFDDPSTRDSTIVEYSCRIITIAERPKHSETLQNHANQLAQLSVQPTDLVKKAKSRDEPPATGDDNNPSEDQRADPEISPTVADVSAQIARSLDCICHGARIPPEADQDLRPFTTFDQRMVVALEAWATNKSSIMIYVESPKSNSRIPQTSTVALHMIVCAIELKIPAISFFCGVPPARDVNENPSENNMARTSAAFEPMLGLVYSLIYQILHYVPPLTKMDLVPDSNLSELLSTSTQTWKSALRILESVLILAPKLLLCFIDDVSALEDKDEEAASRMSDFVRVLRTAMHAEERVLKILFTNWRRSTNLLRYLSFEEKKIFSHPGHVGQMGRRPPGRRPLRGSFLQ